MSITTRAETNGSSQFPSVSPALSRSVWILFLVSLGLGSVGLTMRLVEGHLPAGYGSYVPWGLWVAIYFHSVGIAAGAVGVSFLGFLLRLPGFRHPRSLRLGVVLAVAAMTSALLAIGLDLGGMSRAWRVILTPSFTSMLAFNAWTYLLLLGVGAAVWWLSYRPDRGWLKPVLVLGLVLALMVPSQSGVFLGVVAAKPYWHTALLPILMLASSMASGAAVLLVLRGLFGGDVRVAGGDEGASLRLLRWIALAGLAVYFSLEFAELSIALWSRPSDSPAVSLLLFGPYWWLFWLVHVVLGGLLPAGLLLARRPAGWVGAGGLMAVAFVSTRLNILIPGQAVAQLEGLQEAFTHPRLTHIYQPTVMEYLVALFILAAGMAVLYLGLRGSSALESWVSRKELRDVAR